MSDEGLDFPEGLGLVRKLVAVYVGKAAGKHKYCLFDDEDLDIIKDNTFEAKLVHDPNGCGGRVHVIAKSTKVESTLERLVHDCIWEKHFGAIASEFEVVHKNGVTMDNRLWNLCLAKKDEIRNRPHLLENPQNTLYWRTVCKIPPLRMSHEPLLAASFFGDSLDMNGLSSRDEGDCFFYECHYPPCCVMESELGQFRNFCENGETRYCSQSCKELDSASHLFECSGGLHGSRRSASDRTATCPSKNELDPLPER